MDGARKSGGGCAMRWCCCLFAEPHNVCGRTWGDAVSNGPLSRAAGTAPPAAREPPGCWHSGPSDPLLVEGASPGLGEAPGPREGQAGSHGSRDSPGQEPALQGDPEGATASWLAKATMMLLWIVSIAYVCLAGRMADSGTLEAADRLLPFLTGLVGLVFGFYFSPWRRGR